MFLFSKAKKRLDIKDAVNKKSVTFSVQGKNITVRAFNLGQILEYFAAMQLVEGLIDDLGQAKTAAEITKIYETLQNKIGSALAFCLGDEIKKLDIEKLTAAEFFDIMLAVWSANDMDRVAANFRAATMSKTRQSLAQSPKS